MNLELHAKAKSVYYRENISNRYLEWNMYTNKEHSHKKKMKNKKKPSNRPEILLETFSPGVFTVLCLCHMVGKCHALSHIFT